MTELNQIQKDQNRSKNADSDERGQEDEEMKDEDNNVPAGEVAPKEFDYLLTMPLWSLSEERIIDLNNQMKTKKNEYDRLEGTHIHAIWDKDLDQFLEALQK